MTLLTEADGARERAKENAQSELTILRQELQELKRCQLQYFTLSVTGAAAILGFAGSLPNKEYLAPSLLAPLAIIIPCWWIFFDKATTITRIVGYVRILEELLAKGPSLDLAYPGYEESLTLYREYEDQTHGEGDFSFSVEPSENHPSRARRWIELLALRTRHRYWIVNFYTFAGLAFLCCVSSGWAFFSSSSQALSLLFRYLVLGTGAFLFLGSFIYSIITVHQLVFGKRSYGSSAKLWRVALNANRIKQISERSSPNPASPADA